MITEDEELEIYCSTCGEFLPKEKKEGEEKEWDWSHFKSTKGFPISKELLDWVIGQDKALQECYLCLDEWVYKLKGLEKAKWYEFWKKEGTKTMSSNKLSPGPYLLLLGDPGTGKSLIGRALAEKLTQLYDEHNIKLIDVVSWKNPVIPSEPQITLYKTPEAKKIIRKEQIKSARKSFWKKWGMRTLQGLLLGLGITLLGIGTYFLAQAVQEWFINAPVFVGLEFVSLQEINDYNMVEFIMNKIIGIVPFTFLPGGSLIFFGIFIGFFGRMFGGGGNMKGIGGASTADTPKLIIDNSKKKAPFIDATGHSSAQLFGSIAWDPYQTGGLGTPEHQRVSAGDVHRASLGILYIDEIKNLHPEEAVTLLTVLEDGMLPITLRSQFSGGGTAAMSVSTEPVPCLSFLVAAGNFDSIPRIHPALMDRIYGYGKVVRMNNDMPNTVANRRKYVQFISQEVKRFSLIPFNRGACIELVEEGRRRSNKRDALTTKFRPLISIIKTAAILAINKKKTSVEQEDVKEAIRDHCKTIQKQLLEHYMEENEKLKEVHPVGTSLGEAYGLAVITDHYSHEMAGSVLRLKAQMIKRKKKKESPAGYFRVTGVAKENSRFIQDSVQKVRSVILHKYGIDISSEYRTHLDFSQSWGVDGPSAGVTMTVALCSLLEGKPIRQDVAMTGDINISAQDEVEVTAVGGLYEKIKAAERWGFKTVIIPAKNYEHSINPKDFDIEIIPAKNLDEYLKVLFAKKKKSK